MKGTSIYPKPRMKRPISEKYLLSPCRITFKFLNDALKYAQYHFENKLWNKNEMRKYLRTCCFSKNVVFNAIEAFQQGQEYHGEDVCQNYKEFGIDIILQSLQCICYTWASRNTL